MAERTQKMESFCLLFKFFQTAVLCEILIHSLQQSESKMVQRLEKSLKNAINTGAQFSVVVRYDAFSVANKT